MHLRAWLSLLAVFAGSWGLIAGPVISSFSPIYGATNDGLPITITGSGFYPGTLYLAFNGVEATNYRATLTDGTQITARIRIGTPIGAQPIFVRVNGVGAYSANNFTVIGPGPFVTNFTPVTGSAGTSVDIQGEHFYNNSAAKEVTSVQFNGVAGTNLRVSSDNELTVQAPAGVSTGPITLTSSLGSFTTTNNIISNTTNFFVPPFITGLSPSSGRFGTNFTISGSNFLYATAVLFTNGVSASFTKPVNNTTIQAVVPDNVRSGPITVVAPAGSFPSGARFVVAPTIYGFSPVAGPSGTTVTVTGENFDAGSLTVKFGGVTASSHSTPTFTQFTVTVPSGATNAPITVTTVDGSHTSSQLFYLPPTISSFTPTNSAPGTTITLSGQNFLGATNVTFTGTAPITVSDTTNNTLLTVSVPSGVITGPISLSGPAGTATSVGWFYGAPVINSFTPTHGLPGTNVMIFGTNFSGATAVKFNSVTASLPVNVINPGQINTSVPNGAGTGPITVVGPAGTATTAANFVFDSSDLAVSITDSPDPVFVSSNLVYTITVANNGSLAIPGVLLTNLLPGSGQVVLISASTTQGTLNTNGNPILGNLGSIAALPVTVTLTVSPQAGGTLTDTASVGGGIPDPNLANNTASASTTVWPLPFLSISGFNQQVQISWPGSLTTFSLQFKNALNGAYNWSNVTEDTIVFGGSNIVVESSTNPSRFYRLKQ